MSCGNKPPGHDYDGKGRVRVPKRMNFWKSSKGREVGSFLIKKFMLQVMDLYIGFFGRSEKNARIFSENEGGGQRPYEIFAKIHPFWYQYLSLMVIAF